MIIGIDLGTTNSLACYFDEGETKIIPNRLGENLTPSVVSIDELILLVLFGAHLGLQLDKFVEAGYLGFLRNVVCNLMPLRLTGLCLPHFWYNKEV